MRQTIGLLCLLFFAGLASAGFGEGPCDDAALADDALVPADGEKVFERIVSADIAILTFATNGAVRTNIRPCSWSSTNRISSRVLSFRRPGGKIDRNVVVVYSPDGSTNRVEMVYPSSRGFRMVRVQKIYGDLPEGIVKTVGFYNEKGFAVRSEFFYNDGRVREMTLAGDSLEAVVLSSRILRCQP